MTTLGGRGGTRGSSAGTLGGLGGPFLLIELVDLWLILSPRSEMGLSRPPC